MFDQETYCPYTGLRSFTEEEAIYFKGRDLHIEKATKQLEELKFLMLTGSSGDGKSSLVYAGIVPHARAGFLKSHFSNWIVADFKPERTPFRNLCEVLANKLEIPNVSTVETELSHGYSSLAELYKSSKFYQDRQSPDWIEADDQQKSQLRKNSANLLILADQFEEFFTNPENYFRGVTSQESNLVINLLLETARIAKEENLPIFVVCTMRSDYIGQCAAFRGLPEFIGYSQFFVPRLNRKQLLEVIEEPALLSGNRISKRLVERLVYDITEGVDQLPILQHALNQIWRAADQGKEEMDLIHYAMVGGMSGQDLPEKDQTKFEQWFVHLPQFIQDCYEKPSLQNVLNTHANKLNATIVEHYNKSNEDQISKENARHVIHNMFVCLTKIDHGRAVRNRMTLQEISDITDIEELTPEKVRKITAAFRKPENTLIQPFIHEDGTDPLGDNDVMDISHESLIRNWNLLLTWAKTEYGHVNTYHEFKQQVDRWLYHKKSTDYLLPIGPLTHFETWFNKIEPNKYWIDRYNQDIEDRSERMKSSEKILDDSWQFINSSAQKHIITRAVMHMGARKTAMIVGLLAILILSSFYLYDEYNKSEDLVFDKMLNEGIVLLADENTDLDEKADYVIEMIRHDPDNFEYIFSQLDPLLGFEISLSVAGVLHHRYQHIPNSLFDQSLHWADSMMGKMYPAGFTENTVDVILKNHNDIIYSLFYHRYYQDSNEWTTLSQKYAKALAKFILESLRAPRVFAPQGLTINNAIENILNHQDWTKDEVKEVLSFISPLENDFKNKMPVTYDRDQSIQNGGLSSNMKYNGLYQELAYLYASIGDLEKALECTVRLYADNQAYIMNNYINLTDNATNISAYFLTSGYRNLFLDYLKQHEDISGQTQVDFLEQLAGRSIISLKNENKLIIERELYMNNLNLGLMHDTLRSLIFDLFEDKLLKISSPDERNFKLALFYKQKGLYLSQIQKLRTGNYIYNDVSSYYDQALDYYEKISKDYLNEITIRQAYGVQASQTPRNALFTFPGYTSSLIIWNPRQYDLLFLNTSFLEYLATNNLVIVFYNNQERFEQIEEWTEYILITEATLAFGNSESNIDYPVLITVFNQIRNNGNYRKESLTHFKILLAIHLFELEMESEALEVSQEISFENIIGTFPGVSNFTVLLRFTSVGQLAIHLKESNQDTLFEQLIEVFPRPVDRSSLLAFAASHFGSENNSDLARELIAQAKKEDQLKTTENPTNNFRIATALSSLPKMEGYQESREIWKNLPGKNFANRLMAVYQAEKGFAWRAYEDIESLTPADDKLTRFYVIARGIRLKKGISQDGEWAYYDKTDPWIYNPLFYQIN